jgi:hypothetical protein
MSDLPTNDELRAELEGLIKSTVRKMTQEWPILLESSDLLHSAVLAFHKLEPGCRVEIRYYAMSVLERADRLG